MNIQALILVSILLAILTWTINALAYLSALLFLVAAFSFGAAVSRPKHLGGK